MYNLIIFIYNTLQELLISIFNFLFLKLKMVFFYEYSLIKFIIYILGKTFVLYIIVIKSWYLDSINFIVTPDYTNEMTQSLILLGWEIISYFLKILMILFLCYVYYLHIKLFKIFLILFISECKLILNELKIFWYKLKKKLKKYFNIK
jgi:hypothetical protein